MIKPYNRFEAIRYAQEFALKANPKYYHFEEIGGDCTNFVSQCLLAGGGKMIYNQNGWFYISQDKRSPSWTSVEMFYKFILNDNAGMFASMREVENLEEGDVIQLRQNPTRFNHTLIISRKTKDDIFVCAHSNDALDKNLKDYFYIEKRGIHIEGIKIK